MANQTDEYLDDEQPRDDVALSQESGEESPNQIPPQGEEAANVVSEIDPEDSFDPLPAEDESIFQAAPAEDPAQVRAERERLAAERAARRQAREAALAPVPEPVEEPLPAGFAPTPSVSVAPAPAVVVKRTTDRFAGSLALFLMRLTLAAVLGVRGINGILSPQLASAPWEGNLLPQPQLVGLALSAASIGIAILLVFGMLTRVAGFGVAAIALLTLAFVKWGSFSPFLPDQLGIVGELELLLAAGGLVLMLLGSGAWGVDYGFRRRRAQDKEPRRLA